MSKKKEISLEEDLDLNEITDAKVSNVEPIEDIADESMVDIDDLEDEIPAPKSSPNTSLATVDFQNIPSELQNKKETQTFLYLAEHFAKSGALPKTIKNASQAFMIMSYGGNVGMKPTVALQNLFFIEGKIGMSWQGVLALLQQKGITIKTIKDMEPVYNAQNVVADYITTVRMKRVNTALLPYSNILSREDIVTVEEFTYTWQNASAEGMLGKNTWKKFLRQMMYKTCVLNLARRVAADLLLGFYEIGELLDAQENVDYSNYDYDPETGDTRPKDGTQNWNGGKINLDPKVTLDI